MFMFGCLYLIVCFCFWVFSFMLELLSVYVCSCLFFVYVCSFILFVRLFLTCNLRNIDLVGLSLDHLELFKSYSVAMKTAHSFWLSFPFLTRLNCFWISAIWTAVRTYVCLCLFMFVYVCWFVLCLIFHILFLFVFVYVCFVCLCLFCLFLFVTYRIEINNQWI